MALVVFTHGLGASEADWGSTLSAVRERLPDHEIRPWTYRTSKLPRIRCIRRVVPALRRWEPQSLSELGEDLWSTIRAESSDHDKIILIGHSLGGLVSAAALVHGFTSNKDRDYRVCGKLRGLICIASPFAGASFAEWTSQLYRPLGENRHIDDLRRKSRERKSIILEFKEEVLNLDRLTFILMKAANDEVVNSDEITGPFRPDEYLPEVLEGNHSSCIRDLECDQPNLVKITGAIEELLHPDAAGSRIAKVAFLNSRSVTIREWYDDRLSRMQRNLDILAWGLASFREDYGGRLAEWSERGIQIRLLLVDPDSPKGSVLCELQDMLEERTAGSTASDIRTFLAAIKPRSDGLEVKVSEYHPGTNIFRVDDEMFFGPYLAGTVSRNAPTGFVLSGYRLYERLSSHFEWMWESAYVSSRSSPSDTE